MNGEVAAESSEVTGLRLKDRVEKYLFIARKGKSDPMKSTPMQGISMYASRYNFYYDSLGIVPLLSISLKGAGKIQVWIAVRLSIVIRTARCSKFLVNVDHGKA